MGEQAQPMNNIPSISTLYSLGQVWMSYIIIMRIMIKSCILCITHVTCNASMLRTQPNMGVNINKKKLKLQESMI